MGARVHKVKVGATIQETFAFQPRALRRAWAILLVAAASFVAGAALRKLRPGDPLVYYETFAISNLISVPVLSACFRVGLETERQGDAYFRLRAAGLRWSGFEWRVLAANLFNDVVKVLGVLAAVVAWKYSFEPIAHFAGDLTAFPTVRTSMAGWQAFLTSRSGALSMLVLVPMVLGVGYLAARLSLFPVVAAASRNLNPVKAWRLTRGSTFAVVSGVALVVFVYAVAFYLVYFAAYYGAWLIAYALWEAGVSAPMLGQARVLALVAICAAAIVPAVVYLPLLAGLKVSIYRSCTRDAYVSAVFA
jgi:hypothetical protein